MFGILHRARAKNHVADELRPLVEASLAQCEAPGAVDWLAPRLLGALHQLIIQHIRRHNEKLGARDCDVVAIRVYGELSGVADVFISTALKVHRGGAGGPFQEAAREADRLFAVMEGRTDTTDPALRRTHEEAKRLLAGPLSEGERRLLAAWPRRPNWHVALVLWQRCVSEAMARARHAYGAPRPDHPSHAPRRQIDRALETAGLAVDEAIPVVFANRAAMAAAARILLENGIFLELSGSTWSPQQRLSPASHDEKLIAALLAFHIQREISRRLGIDRARRFPKALAPVFGDISQTECLVLTREVERAVAKLAGQGTGAAIEGAIGAWIERPGARAFGKLVRLEGVLAAHAPSLKAA